MGGVLGIADGVSEGAIDGERLGGSESFNPSEMVGLLVGGQSLGVTTTFFSKFPALSPRVW